MRIYAHRMANRTQPLNLLSMIRYCGALEIKFSLRCPIKNVVRCNCSVCSSKCVVMTIAETEKLEVLKGHSIKEYTLHTKSLNIGLAQFSAFILIIIHGTARQLTR